MAYTDTFGPKGTPLSLSWLDRALRETAQGQYSEAVQYGAGTIGYGIRSLAGSVAAAQAAVAGLPPAADINDLTKAKNVLDAGKVSGLPGGQTLAQFAANVSAFMQGGGNAPVVTSPPTITGNLGVGLVLTAVAGNVTTSGGHNYTNSWTWNRENASNPRAPIPNEITTTHNQSAADITFYLSVTQTPRDSVTGALGSPSTSALVGPVTGNVPGFTVDPSISPSGTQPSTQVLTLNSGTANIGGCTFSYLFYANGTAQSTRSTTVNTFLPGSTNNGKVITGDVIAISPLGVPSAPRAASNSVTISGTVGTHATSLPTLQGVSGGLIYKGQSYAITAATWVNEFNTPVTPTSRTWDFYVNGAHNIAGYSSTNAAYNVDGNVNPPDIVQIVERAVIGGIEVSSGLTGATQYTVTAAAANAAFQAIVDMPTLTFTTGQVVSPIVPVRFINGAPPYTAQINPQVPGLTISSGNAALSGVAGTVGSATYNISAIDSNAAGAYGSVIITIASAQSIVPVASFRASQPISSMPGAVQYGQDWTTLSSLTESGYTAGQSSLIDGSNLRFGKVTKGGRTCLRLAIDSNDTETSEPGARRADLSGFASFPVGAVVWYLEETYIPDFMWDRASGQYMLLWDLHTNSNPTAGMQVGMRSWTSDNKLMFECNHGNNPYTEVNIAGMTTYRNSFVYMIGREYVATDGSGWTELWVNGAMIPGGRISGVTCSGGGVYMKIACYNSAANPIPSGGYAHYFTQAHVIRDDALQYTVSDMTAFLAANG
jgi:hypothetical protein